MSRREFHFVEGSSSKFWAIEVEGSSFTVSWGRIGTSGQTQVKEFASDTEAQKQADKLIAEKVGKGYKETGNPASTATAASKPSAVPNTTTATKSIAPKPAKSKSTVTVAEPAVEASPVATLAAPVIVDAERSIDLDPADLNVASWRPRNVLTRGEPRPFDLKQRLADLARVPARVYGWQWDWSAARIPAALKREEAHFWLTAMCTADNKIKPPDLAQKIEGHAFGKASAAEVDKLLKQRKIGFGPEILGVLVHLLPLEKLIDLLDEKSTKNRSGYIYEHALGEDPEMMFGFRRHVLPYLDEGELERVREVVRPRIDIKEWPADHYNRPRGAFYIAAMVGLSAELLPIIQSWAPGYYQESGWDHTHYHQPQILVLGLGDAKHVESEMRRHKLPLNKPEYVRGWLATTEYAALDYLRDSILVLSNKEEAEKLLKEFLRVKAPEAAPHMLELKSSSKAPKLAREWLDSNLGFAISGLIPVAAGRGKLADAAVEHLRDLRRAGHLETIAKLAGTPPPERVRTEVLDHVEKTYVPLDAATTPTWLGDALGSASKPGKLPAWLPVHTIPILTIGEQRLNDLQLQLLITELQKRPLGTPGPLIEAIRANASRESRDAFAWKLFEMWHAEGAPSKDKWAMGAIGHLGGDGCVLKLTPLIRNWPGESQHQRAVFGLECLRAIGSDTALMSLNGIAQKLKFKGLKAKAMEFMDAIATQRNMTRAQLEDRIVPDCDLDARGTRVFDFGPRQFRLVLGAEMKPMIKDADGKVKSDLPSPGVKDNAALASEAVATWKLLKKQVKEVAKIQAERLEQAMVTGRRWTPEEFDTLLVKHPLMINLVRLVVWAAYDKTGKPLATFRVTEDQTLADERDEEIDIPTAAESVGIVHPAHLEKTSLAAWGGVFSDYEIIPPFEQLGRRVNALEGAEGSGQEFKRFEDLKVEAVTLVGILERLAWVRGIPEDAGIFYQHSKPFPGADVTCVVQYEPGVGVGYITESEEQSGLTAFFIPGVYKPSMYPDHKLKLKLGDIDPVVMSEVIRDLNVIASKAKA